MANGWYNTKPTIKREVPYSASAVNRTICDEVTSDCLALSTVRTEHCRVDGTIRKRLPSLPRAEQKEQRRTLGSSCHRRSMVGRELRRCRSAPGRRRKNVHTSCSVGRRRDARRNSSPRDAFSRGGPQAPVEHTKIIGSWCFI